MKETTPPERVMSSHEEQQERPAHSPLAIAILWNKYIPSLQQDLSVQTVKAETRSRVLRTIMSEVLSSSSFCQQLVLLSTQNPEKFPLIGPEGLLEVLLRQSIKEEVAIDFSLLLRESIAMTYKNLKDHRDIISEADLRLIRELFESPSADLHRLNVLSLLKELLESRPKCYQVLSNFTILRDYPPIHRGCPICGFQDDGAPGLLLVVHGTDVRARQMAMNCAAMILSLLPLSKWMHHLGRAHIMWSFQNKVIRAVEDLLRISICKPFCLHFSTALLQQIPFDNHEKLHALGVKLLEKASKDGYTSDLLKACLGGRLDTRGRLVSTPSPMVSWIEQNFDFASLQSRPDTSIAVLRAVPKLVFQKPENMERVRRAFQLAGQPTTRSALCEALLKGRKLQIDDNRISVDVGRVFIPTLVSVLNNLLDLDRKCQSSYCSAMGFFYHSDWVMIPFTMRRRCLEQILSFCEGSKNHATKDLIDSWKALGHLCSSLIESEHDLTVSEIGEDLYQKIVFTMVEAKSTQAVQCLVLFSVGNLFHALNKAMSDRGLLQCSALASLVEKCRSTLKQQDNDKIHANGMRASCRLAAWLHGRQVTSVPIDDFIKEVLHVCSTSLQQATVEKGDEPRKVKQRIMRNACSACHSLGPLFDCGVLSVDRFSEEAKELIGSWINAVLMLHLIGEKFRLCLLQTFATTETSKLKDVVAALEERAWSNAIRSVFLYSVDCPGDDIVEPCFCALEKMISSSSRQHIVVAFDSIGVREGRVKEGVETLLRRPFSKELRRILSSGLSVMGLDFATEQKMHHLLNIADDSDEL